MNKHATASDAGNLANNSNLIFCCSSYSASYSSSSLPSSQTAAKMWSIFTILLAATASSALALPPQTILVDDDLVEITMPFRYDINASWTTTCPDGQTVSCPHDEEETCCDNIKNNDSKWIIGDVPCPTPNPCLPSQSCCRTKTDYIGCCPYKNGVCCLGGSLCCPGGMRCNLKEMICEYKDVRILFLDAYLSI